MKVWLDKNSTIDVGDKTIRYGDKFDEKKVNAKTLKALAAQDKFGDKIVTEKELEKVVSEKANEAHKEAIEKLKTAHLEELEKVKSDFAKELEKVNGEIKIGDEVFATSAELVKAYAKLLKAAK